MEVGDNFSEYSSDTNSVVSDDDLDSENTSVASFRLGSKSSSKNSSKRGSPIIGPITEGDEKKLNLLNDEEKWNFFKTFDKEKIGPPPPTPMRARRAAWGALDTPPPFNVPTPLSDDLPPELTVFGEEDDAPAYYDLGTTGNVGTTENDEDWKTTEWVANWEGEDAPGYMIVERDIKGNAIYGWDDYGYPIFGYDENNKPIYFYDENGVRILEFDGSGNPRYEFVAPDVVPEEASVAPDVDPEEAREARVAKAAEKKKAAKAAKAARTKVRRAAKKETKNSNKGKGGGKKSKKRKKQSRKKQSKKIKHKSTRRRTKKNIKI